MSATVAIPLPVVRNNSETILLLGDSLTQQGFQTQWVSRLADLMCRRMDVLNRGLSGYNTRWTMALLHDDASKAVLIPKGNRYSFVVLFFGANDSVREGLKQHVPLAEYDRNLREMIALVLREAQPSCGVILITPPPIDEAAYLRFVQERYPEETESSRTLHRTRQYRDVVLNVAGSVEGVVGVVDLYQTYIGSTDGADSVAYSPNPSWGKYFSDGLHVNAEGGALLFESLHDTLRTSKRSTGEPLWPLVDPATTQMTLPGWPDW